MVHFGLLEECVGIFDYICILSMWNIVQISRFYFFYRRANIVHGYTLLLFDVI